MNSIEYANAIRDLLALEIDTPSETVYRASEDTSQELHIEGMPFRTRGGMKIEHEFPATASTLLRVSFGSLDTGNGDMLGHYWIPLNYAEGLVRVVDLHHANLQGASELTTDALWSCAPSPSRSRCR